MVCLGAEFERRRAAPVPSGADEDQRAAIESALEAERFELYVQPIRSLRAASSEPPPSRHTTRCCCGCAPRTAR